MVWPFFVNLAISLAISAISYVLKPKPKNQAPTAAGLGDFNIPTAEEGRPIPVIFGTPRISGPNVVWRGDLKVEPIRVKGGKK